MDPPVWSADAAVERLLALEAKGWKFHELRKRVVDMLGACDNPPFFIVECVEHVVAERERRRIKKSEQLEKNRGAGGSGHGSPGGNGGGGDAAADPLVHLLLECLPKVNAWPSP
jgi:hypothetical protein